MINKSLKYIKAGIRADKGNRIDIKEGNNKYFLLYWFILSCVTVEQVSIKLFWFQEIYFS